MDPPAPGLFSIMTGCFQELLKYFAKTLAVISVPEPAPGPTIFTVRLGYYPTALISLFWAKSGVETMNDPAIIALIEIPQKYV